MLLPPSPVAALSWSLLLAQASLAQRVSIVNPPNGSEIIPGKNLTVVLEAQSTTSSLSRLSFSLGFNAKPSQDPTSLGRPYVATVVAGPDANGTVAFSNNTYTFNVTVPPAKDFLDGVSSGYTFNVANYYLLGATYTPKLDMVGVNVSISNSTSGENPTPSGNNTYPPGPTPGTNSSTPGGKPPTGGQSRVSVNIQAASVVLGFYALVSLVQNFA